ncbi:dUTP diphosphatase [Stenotrophomonas phage BUCTxx99]|nr:dUTP diphosphatase [Stenotrophomonas phage BUCTxx99]
MTDTKQDPILAAMAASVNNLTDRFTITEPVIKVVVTDPRVSQDDLPVAHTSESAGLDLRAYPRGGVERVEKDAVGNVVKSEWVDDAPLDYLVIKPGEQVLVSTGLRVWINKPGYAGFMFARSGMGVKGLVLGNGTGVIDSDYQGELKMCLWNRGYRPIRIEAGDRVAQLVIMPVMTGYKMEVVDAFDAETERGTGGFGSTGSK